MWQRLKIKYTDEVSISFYDYRPHKFSSFFNKLMMMIRKSFVFCSPWYSLMLSLILFRLTWHRQFLLRSWNTPSQIEKHKIFFCFNVKSFSSSSSRQTQNKVRWHLPSDPQKRSAEIFSYKRNERREQLHNHVDFSSSKEKISLFFLLFSV